MIKIREKRINKDTLRDISNLKRQDFVLTELRRAGFDMRAGRQIASWDDINTNERVYSQTVKIIPKKRRII